MNSLFPQEWHEWARREIDELAAVYGSRTAVYNALAELGFSKHTAQKFMSNQRPNTTVPVLDDLVRALRILRQRRAA